MTNTTNNGKSIDVDKLLAHINGLREEGKKMLAIAMTDRARGFEEGYDRCLANLAFAISTYEAPEKRTETSVSNARFVRIDVRDRYVGSGEYRWTEWFCLDSVWVNPYNRDGRNAADWDKVEAYRKWCDDAMAANPALTNKWHGVCPDITIGGAVLNDGWGSDIVGRVCSYFSDADKRAWGDRLEETLLTGKVTSIRLENEGVVLETTFTPYESITPDPDSVADFGEWADAALEGLR